MIKVKQKPIKEIEESIKDFQKILNIGCGGCASICLGGGQKEVNTLNAELGNSRQMKNKTIDSFTVERQCNMKFLADLDQMVNDYDCLMSMACGAGIQYLAERFPEKPVIPAVNTIAIGVDVNVGIYQERCRACGECVLAYSAGICPVTRCAKGLFNGPCGGTNNGKCEISDDVPCAWYEIYNRLEKQGRLDLILNFQPLMEWKNQTLRTIIQDPYAERYAS